jgi:hypothetical protein
MAAFYPSEELWVPIHTLAVSLRSLLPLHVFNLSLGIGRYVLVSPLHSLSHIMPELLRFPVILFFYRPSRRWSMFGMCGVE